MSEVAKINDGVVAKRRSTLAISPEQAEFTAAQVEALKKMNGWRDVPHAELSVFFHQCQRTGLDPFVRQIYLIPRGGSYTIQTAIDGMRLVADRTNRYAGSDRPRFGEEDGDRYAEVTVWKLVGNPATRVAFTGVAFESEFRDDRSPMWKKMPKTMLAKTGEAQALRKAFPADLSGIYGSEEMDQAGPPTTQTQPEDKAIEAEVVNQGQATSKSKPESQGNPLGGNAYEDVRESDHRIVVSEIEDMLQKAPDGFFEHALAMVEYARESYEKSLAVRKKMRRLLEEGKPSSEGDREPDDDGGYPRSATPLAGDIDLDEDDAREIDRMSGGAPYPASPSQPRATNSQVSLLKTLVFEARGEDGVAKLEEHVGKSISELTRTEADSWIDRFTPTTGEFDENSEESANDAEDEAANDAEDTEGRPNKNDLPATRKQLNYLESLVADVEDGVARFEEKAGKRIADLTCEEASEWIGELSGKAAE